LFSLPIHHYVSTQTLTTLSLSRNQIVAKGAEHLAQALENNMVRRGFFSLRIHHFVSIQTLTTLNLAGNEIGAKGAQHLAQALQINTVRKVFFFFTTYSPL
jgi:hypothetical protein